MESTADSATECSCGAMVESNTEDFSYIVQGLEIIVPECDVRRCSCGKVSANFDPVDVERQVAVSIIDDAGRFTEIQGKFILSYVLERMGKFPTFNTIA